VNPAIELIECRSQSVKREPCRVIRRRRQSANGAQQLFSPQHPRLPRSLPPHKLGKGGSACHGRNAAFGLKANLVDLFALEFDREPERIAAGWILDLGSCIRIGDDARIAGMLEVVENFAGVHPVRLTRRCSILEGEGLQ
jgi:hypothetical protein